VSKSVTNRFDAYALGAFFIGFHSDSFLLQTPHPYALIAA
jgi:hypothetical protein